MIGGEVKNPDKQGLSNTLAVVTSADRGTIVDEEEKAVFDIICS